MDDETTFAKINREAEQKRSAWIADENIWNTPEVWMQCGRSSDGLRPTEDAVFSAYSSWARLRFQQMTCEVIREVLSEMATLPEPVSPQHQMPLREIMYLRGETLQWLDLGRNPMTGKRSITQVVVSLDAPSPAKKRR